MESLIKLQETAVFDIPGLGRFDAELEGNSYCLHVIAKKKLSFDEIKIYTRSGEYIDTMRKTVGLQPGDPLSIMYEVNVEVG